MNLSQQVAKNVRDAYFGGNWTGVNVREVLMDVNLEQATTQIGSLNTIAALVFHIGYYVDAVMKVLKGGELTASDKFSFDHPPIESESDWQDLLNKTWNDAEAFANLIEGLPDERILQPFLDGKYGNYFRNLAGPVEHLHYHLGQIVLIKKLIKERTSS